MVTVILTHEVKNYADWKVGFDGDEANRAQMGVSIIGVYQDVDNHNMVTIISEVASAEAIKGFLANPDMQMNMEKLGVIGVPTLRILNKI